MSAADHYAAGCQGKEPFTTKAKALDTIRRIAKQHRDTRARTPLHAYRCRFCGAFHIGGKEK